VVLVFGLTYFFVLGWAFARTNADKALLAYAHRVYRQLIEEAVQIRQETEARELPEAVPDVQA
jgi:hypothetical protein